MKDTRTYIFTHRRSVLETVPGAAANNPDILQLGMPVNQEIAIGSVLVLADPGFHDWSIPQSRDMFAEVTMDLRNRLLRDHPHLGIWVDIWAVAVKSDLY